MRLLTDVLLRDANRECVHAPDFFVKDVPAIESAASRGSMRVDVNRLFIPEQFTPLFHTAAYAGLAPHERRRYNQLYALYFNEQIIFFETSLAERVLLPLAASGLPATLADGLRAFVEEERRHTRMFRELNRACAPAWLPCASVATRCSSATVVPC